MYAHTMGTWGPEPSVQHLLLLSISLLRQGHSLNLELTKLARWVANQLWKSTCLWPHPSRPHRSISFCPGAVGPNSSHLCSSLLSNGTVSLTPFEVFKTKKIQPPLSALMISSHGLTLSYRFPFPAHICLCCLASLQCDDCPASYRCAQALEAQLCHCFKKLTLIWLKEQSVSMWPGFCNCLHNELYWCTTIFVMNEVVLGAASFYLK